MSTLDPASSGHLAELLVSAAERLAAPAPPSVLLAPMGVPIRSGRHLGRLRSLVPVDADLVVAAGFGTACWVGEPGADVPNLDRLGYRATAVVDDRDRIVLDRRVRTWLAVEDERQLPEVRRIRAVTACGGSSVA